MILPRFRSSAGRSAWVLALALAASGGGLAAISDRAVAQQVQVQVQVNPTQAPPDQDPYGVYLPTDRTLARGVARAKESLQAGEFNEALAFLQQILDRDEDVFVADDADSSQLQGLKAAARALIAGLPAAGKEMYALLHSAAARRSLEAALASGDRDQLAQLVQRYFLTAPGCEAAIILAQTELDRGHPLAAAHLYDELLAEPALAASFEPQLSLLSAVCDRAAGRDHAAADRLRALAEKFSGAEIELAGQKRAVPAAGLSDPDLLAWLDEAVGRAQAADTSQRDWLTLRGDSSRNAEHHGGAPHLSPRWESRVVNDPRFENFLSARREQAEQQGLVAIPAARPIAAGNVVLMRTPQNVVALDWKTGKRIWETREEESSVRDQYLADFSSENRGDDFSPLRHPLEQRVWDDTLTMSLSSDGERAFALGGMSLVDRDDQAAWNVGPGFGGQYDFTAAPTNRLTAYELATEGKLAWEIDGANAAGDLAGVFFLGTPVAVDGTLYVLAEIRSAIYLLALEPASGKLLWRQQLAGLEQGITLDPQRRLNAAVPSYSEGILVCPTTAGIVVAVDLVRREFAWVYRYPRQIESFATIRPGWQGRADVAFPRANNHWLDGAPLVTDGKVLLTPPESGDLHCLELTSGKLLWKKPREKALFVACVDRGNILVVAADSVTALRLTDGAPAWQQDFALPAGVSPSGLGYLSEGHYYLPLTSGKVLALDTADGAGATPVDSASETDLGNLICQRGSIISQSAIFLDKFEQIDILRERAKSALAANPRDAAAIRDLAEMRRLEGALPEAVTMLKQAYHIDPADLITRDMLASALLESLSGDYAAYQADLPLLRQIVDRPQQQIELLRVDARGLTAAGKRLEAFAAYLNLIDATVRELTPLTIGPELTVRSDRLVRAQLNDLWTAATPDERNQIARQIKARREAWPKVPAASDLRSYLAYFAGLPGTDEIRQQLIRALVERSEPLEVEMELLRLERSPAKQAQAASAILFTQWLIGQGRLADAAPLAESIASRWSHAAAVDGKSPAQWLNDWRQEFSGAGSTSWPRGRISVEELPATAVNRPELTRRAQAEFQLGLRKLRIGQTEGPACGPSLWLVAQDGSRLIGRDAAGQEVFRFNVSRRSAMRRFAGNSDFIEAAQLGDLLYVTLGGQIVAIDTRQRDENDDSDVVWQSNRPGRFSLVAPRSVRPNVPALYHPWSRRTRVAATAGGLSASLGPVTSGGVVFQEQQQLRCVDPLSGETLWSRNDLPLGCELFGDDEFVLAADSEAKTLDIYRFSDGELVQRRELPESPWLLTAGRHVAQLLDTQSGGKARKTLRILDAVSGKKLFEADYDPGVRMSTLEPNYIAVVEPSGAFELIDVRSMDKPIATKLRLRAAPRSITLFRSGNQLFLCVSGPARLQSSRPIGIDYPLVDGEVFAFDLRDGRMIWPGAAVIDSRGIALTQPEDTPVLIFVDRFIKRDAGGSGTKLRLLCLDRDTGATIYRNDNLPDTSGGQFRIRASHGDMDSVDIEMTAKTIRLKSTKLPRSPEPPANDLVEAPRKSLGRGLWGVTRRMGSVLQDVIQNSSGSSRGANPEDENEGQTDDD